MPYRYALDLLERQVRLFYRKVTGTTVAMYNFGMAPDRTIQPPFWTPPHQKRRHRQRWSVAAQHWRRRRHAFRDTGEAMPTITQVPPPWSVIRLAARMGTPYADGHVPLGRWMGSWLDWLFSRPSALLHQSATVRFLAEFIAGVAIVIALVGFWLDLQNREEDRVNRAWSLVAAAKEVEGNLGLIEALETLNARNIGMSQLQAPKTYLSKVKLAQADLNRANLSGADLTGADLSGARLFMADLSGANLFRANLSGVILSMSDLSGADLRWADLPGDNLSEADRPQAIGLTQEQLDKACGDNETKLLPGLTVPICSK
jgi:hypothetical protein